VKIYIQEEYGYRHWKLTTDKFEQQIIDWWLGHPFCNCLHKIPEVFGHLGKVEQIDEPFDSEITFHYHENQDSSLCVRGKFYKHLGWTPDWE